MLMIIMWNFVLLPYKITLLSNPDLTHKLASSVLLPYKITLLSNNVLIGDIMLKFYYPIKLHYSQTMTEITEIFQRFYYPIKLHYSQTIVVCCSPSSCVLLPYKITLLSNLKFKIMTLLISAFYIRQ